MKAGLENWLYTLLPNHIHNKCRSPSLQVFTLLTNFSYQYDQVAYKTILCRLNFDFARAETTTSPTTMFLTNCIAYFSLPLRHLWQSSWLNTLTNKKDIKFLLRSRIVLIPPRTLTTSSNILIFIVPISMIGHATISLPIRSISSL